MKFTTSTAFDKHLQASRQDHLCDTYLILDPEDYVQKKWAKKIISADQLVESFDGQEANLSDLKMALESASMFTTSKCVCLYNCNKLSKEGFKSLQKYCENPHPAIRLILTGSSMPKELFFLNKSAVILDLTLEKPWDRDKRLALDVQVQFSKEKIQITLMLAEQLVKTCGSQVSIIDNETEKLICALVGKSQVSRQDLDQIPMQPQHSIFKIGQAVLENQIKEALQMAHLQKFPIQLLIYSLRSLFQRSFRLKELSMQEVAQLMPQLKGPLLEKNLKWIQHIGPEQFKKMLRILFEIELLSKNQAVAEEFLTSLLLMKIGALYEPVSI